MERDLKLATWRGLLSAALCLTGLAAQAQLADLSRPFFDVYSESVDNSLGRQSIQTRDGGYITVGEQNDSSTSAIVVTKLNAKGQVVWQNAYVSPGLCSDGFVIAQTSSGYVVAGTSGPSITLDTDNLVVLALDANGGLNWSRAYSEWPNSSFMPFSVNQTPDSGFLVGAYGYFPSPSGFALRLDGSGNILWQKAAGLLPGMVTGTADGGAVISGYDVSAPASFPVVVRLDGSGNVAWEKQYPVGTVASYFSSARPTDDGGFIVSGSYTLSNKNDRALVLRLDANGNVTHQQAFQSGVCSSLDGADAQPSTSGGYLFEPICGAEYIAKLDAQDNVLWQEEFDYTSQRQGMAAWWFTATADGSYVATGVSGKGVNIAHSIALKVDSSGSLGSCKALSTASPELSLSSSPAAQVSNAAISVIDGPVTGVDAGVIPMPTTVTTKNGCRL